MKRWMILIPIAAILVAAGLTWQLWFPPTWEFLTTQKDPLASMRNLVVVFGAIIAIVVALRRFLWSPEGSGRKLCAGARA